MVLAYLCGYLPSAGEKKTLRQKILELAGRSWIIMVGVKDGLATMPTQAVSLFQSGTSFSVRFSSLVAVVLTATAYTIVPYGLFKVLSVIAFLFASEAMVVTSWPAFWDGTVVWIRTLYKLSTRKGLTWKPLTPGMGKIADNIGIKIDKIGVMDDLDNAVSLPAFKTIIIGRPLYDKLDETALNAVFAHELVHVKEKHNLIPLIALPVILSQLVLWFNLPIQMFAIAGLAFSRIAFIPFNWMVEIRADQVGARFVGSDAMIHALEALDGKKMDEHSESHPSLRRRIRRLRIGPISRFWYYGTIFLILVGAVLAWVLLFV